MKHLLKLLPALILALLFTNCQRSSETEPFQSYWNLLPDRYWIGPEFWANRLQDWQLKKGRLECINADLPKRTLHLLNRYLTTRPGSLDIQVTTGLIRKSAGTGEQVIRAFFSGQAPNPWITGEGPLYTVRKEREAV